MPSHRWHSKDNDTPAERARDRKYNSRAHRNRRALLAPLVHAGLALCWRCGEKITTGPWHLGHDDHDTDRYRGPEHARCNIEAAARKGQRVAARNAEAARGGPVGFVRPTR